MAYNPLIYRGGPVSSYSVYDGVFMKALRDMSQWEVLGGRCPVCPRIGWLDRKAVMAKIGNHYLINVRRRLRCSACSNPENDLLLGQMDRNA